MKTVVVLAQGVEEMEAVIATDVLRRAGWEVTTAALQPGVLTASRKVRLVADATWDELRLDDYECLLLPGGAEGTRRLRAHPGIIAAVQAFVRSGRWVAAICAAPLVLQDAGVLVGVKATCHPGVAGEFTATPRCNDPVAIDEPIVTSQGAGTSFDFALALIEVVDGAPAAARVARDLVYERT